MDIKNMKYEKVYLTAGLVFSAVLGTLSHFFYEWSGQNPVVALFSPVNESTWEHMKLVFFQILVWSLLLPAGIRKDFPAMRGALLAGGLLGTWLVPVLFYTYSGILGRDLALIDIGIFYAAVLAAFWTAPSSCLMPSRLMLSCLSVSCLMLPCDNVYRYIKDLRHFQDRIDMSACGSGKVVGRAAFAPAGHELSRAACKACPHICISEGEDRAFLIDAFRHDELEVSVAVLCDRQVSHRTCVRIELGQVAAACLSMEHFHDLHGRFLIRDIRVS